MDKINKTDEELKYCYKYPHPSVTTDCVIFGFDGTKLRVLLVQRGIELDIPYKEPRTRLIKEQHCFTGCSGTNVIRLLPPLCLSMEEAQMFIDKLKGVL